MIDLSQLSAADFARQLARPSGETGLAVGEYMSRVNRRLIMAACQRLAPPPHSRILEIGFGNGELIGEVLMIAPSLHYVGVEVSKVMVAAAREHNHTYLEEGRIELHLGSVERLPFADATFDRALTVNTIYFWPNQLNALREIRRVLRSNGRLTLASMTPETSAKSSTARPEHGFNVPDRDELLSQHRLAGFRHTDCTLYEEESQRLDGAVYRRYYHLVAAHC